MRKRPVLVYDGDCGFCTQCVRWVERMPTDAKMVPWQFADLDNLGTSAARAEYEVLWVHRDGRIEGGADAVAALLEDCGGWRRIAGRLIRLRGINWLAHRIYRWVADNRHRLPGGTPACSLPAEERPGARA
jgi:predicted DCC family thiol-disulfide oxidoreductase YuxK